MLIARKFLHWSIAASFTERAQAASQLAEAFLYDELAEEEREEARLILTSLLEDASPHVRRALAEQFATAVHVPHFMVLSLAGDEPEIAAIVLAHSPLLSDAELIDFIATAGAIEQTAIAMRPVISAAVAAALAEVGGLEALIALTENEGADILEFSLSRMVERHGESARLRAALLARPNPSACLRSEIAGAAAKSLAAAYVTKARLPAEHAMELSRDAREKANLEIAASIAGDSSAMQNFVSYLRGSSQLTAGLLLRGLLCGNTQLFAIALSDLAKVPVPRAIAAIAKHENAAFAALYRRAVMPQRLLPVFRAALQAIAALRCTRIANAQLQRPLILSVIEACASSDDDSIDQLIARLRRFEAEAAREEARDFCNMAAPAAASGQPPAPALIKPAARPARDGQETGHLGSAFQHEPEFARECAAA